MPYMNCRLLSPVHIGDVSEPLIPPVIYLRRVYIVQDKKIFKVLEKVGLLKEFILVMREKGFTYISKWLNSKGLLNENFLENISKYWIDDDCIRKINNYKTFEKNADSNPVISDDFFKNLFKKAILYRYIKERRDEFNFFVSAELNFLEQELECIEDISNYSVRKNIYQRNIFKHLIENFLINSDQELINIMQNLENLDITMEKSLNSEDLSTYRVGNLDNYKNFKFKLSNIAQKECLKENSFIKFNVTFYRNTSEKYANIQYLDWLIDQVYILTRDKLSFDRRYIMNLLNVENFNDNFSLIGTLKSINNCLNFVAENVNNDTTNINVALLENSKALVLNTDNFIANTIINYYNYIDNSNLLIYSKNELNEITAILNLEKSNIERINRIIFGKNNKIETDIVKFSFKKGNLPCSPFGYAAINL